MSDAAEMDRKTWMGLLARAPAADVARLWAEADLPEPVHDWLRPPETGAVMVRGRAGATGAPFNLGEMTVTRCALRLADGREGHAWVQGRDKAHARRAALADALMQGAESGAVRAALLAPLAEAEAARRAATARRAAASKVEFFTMARGED
ncbi:phosphonate C-P lyase system protein PhnG [Rhodovulum sp. 12E13]|uniref:phosphonate C-P lyase system protein PhnG n=1 Tax=Rhodovulum sp. 12E13 TaxID=2203891 RepID=UPI000E1718D8|nr:phosphonate C-P lyase system protein PhnG [Rhodovulum sp. 12E13]RDC73680.1 phosphonate C-P lyase system protein PhnG [Rhodovulum sp. 12E13]